MKSVVATAAGIENIKVIETPIPDPGPNEVRIKVLAAAINPADFVYVSGLFPLSYPVYLGFDGAGLIDAVGSKVKNFQPGDPVFATSLRREVNYNTFAEYFIYAADQVGRIPANSNISFESAATISVGALTSAVAQFHYLGLPLPSELGSSVNELKGKYFLVWGGSSSVGGYAVQFANLVGMKVIATCSPSNFELVKKFGATHVLDYHDANVVQQIQQLADRNVLYALDAVGGESLRQCLEVLNHGKLAKFCTAVPWTKAPTDIIPANVQFTPLRLNDVHGNAALELFMSKLYGEISALLASGQLIPGAYEKLENGFDHIAEGIARVGQKQVSGKKLVVTLD